ncbi:MAG: hypothetical protein HKN70_04820, partial [Gammaproteobacteria bacterium]|nr:hypothetical protein [Gammaproteobacteria bacterium]
ATPISGLQASMLVVTGDQVDFDNTKLGEQLRIRPTIDYNIGKHFLFRARHTYSTLDTKTGDKIFTANQSDLRFTYQFNVRSFLRLVVQHTDIDRNTAVYVDAVDANSRFLGTQLLYSYKVNPQTVLFVGYSDAAEDGDTLTRFTKSSRTFFAKIGYAWLP